MTCQGSVKVDRTGLPPRSSAAAAHPCQTQPLADLGASYCGPDKIPNANVTTFMIRNVPRSYSLGELIAELRQFTPLRSFDFVYLPWDVRRDSNITFAFVNFVSTECAKGAFFGLSGRRWAHSPKGKSCRLVPARLQGLYSNLAHFAETVGLHCEGRHLPLVLHQGRSVGDLQAVLDALTPEDDQAKLGQLQLTGAPAVQQPAPRREHVGLPASGPGSFAHYYAQQPQYRAAFANPEDANAQQHGAQRGSSTPTAPQAQPVLPLARQAAGLQWQRSGAESNALVTFGSPHSMMQHHLEPPSASRGSGPAALGVPMPTGLFVPRPASPVAVGAWGSGVEVVAAAAQMTFRGLEAGFVDQTRYDAKVLKVADEAMLLGRCFMGVSVHARSCGVSNGDVFEDCEFAY